MKTISIRLTGDEERRIAEIQTATGWTQSEVVRRSIGVLAASTPSRPQALRDAVKSLDLGPGGYAIGPSTRVRESVRKAIMAKRRARAGE